MTSGYSVVNKSYSYLEHNSIIGPGQGSTGRSGASSTMAFILLMAIDRLAHGMYVCSPNHKVEFTTRLIMFFDDKTNYNNNFLQDLKTKQDSATSVQSLGLDSQHWERILGTSEGKLKFIKCGYYVMIW